MALHYIAGLLKHARALSAIIAPTTNSYKRLVPGYEAPVNLAYSRRNRSAAVSIPMYSASPKAKRVEFRPPDPSSNPYMGFAAMLMAGWMEFSPRPIRASRWTRTFTIYRRRK
jgi:glutamine synthetase